MYCSKFYMKGKGQFVTLNATFYGSFLVCINVHRIHCEFTMNAGAKRSWRVIRGRSIFTGPWQKKEKHYVSMVSHMEHTEPQRRLLTTDATCESRANTCKNELRAKRDCKSSVCKTVVAVSSVHSSFAALQHFLKPFQVHKSVFAAVTLQALIIKLNHKQLLLWFVLQLPVSNYCIWQTACTLHLVSLTLWLLLCTRFRFRNLVFLLFFSTRPQHIK